MKRILAGAEDFKELLDKDCYFVDKSELISDIVSNPAKVYLFTRPRRFGKSLNLSMIDAFFNQKYKGNTWFDELKITEHPNCLLKKNIYPVISISMKDFHPDNYELFMLKLRSIISRAYDQFKDLADDEKIGGSLRKKYLEKPVDDFNQIELEESIKSLCEMLEIHFGKKAIVLIDEYDNPINHAFNKEVYSRIIGLLRNFYSATFKSNDHLEFAVVTGVMQIAKESIFSGLNNLSVNNIFSETFDERYGFTGSEVRKICEDFGHPEKFDEAKDWYDGYRFGKAEIYNPWSVLEYVRLNFVPAAYWAGTSGNDIIDTLLDRGTEKTYSELASLANEQVLNVSLSPSVAMSELAYDPSAIYSVMAMSGYLNAVPAENGYDISIPNTEMKSVFAKMMLKHIHSDAEIAFGNLFRGFETGDLGLVNKGLTSVFDESIPFILLTDEKMYQLIIGAAAMSSLGRYRVSLEKESGNGRADIVMERKRPNCPNIIVELKHIKRGTKTKMQTEADLGIGQIKNREYFRKMERPVHLWGICFQGKSWAVSFEKVRYCIRTATVHDPER